MTASALRRCTVLVWLAVTACSGGHGKGAEDAAAGGDTSGAGGSAGAGAAGAGMGGSVAGQAGVSGASGVAGASGAAGASGTAGTAAPIFPCSGLQCRQSTCRLGNCTVPACPNGGRTTLSGKVYDPAGTLPLFNVTVYVPNGELAPIPDGPSCDPCDAKTGLSPLAGDPVVVTHTDETGTFHLGLTGPDVPAGADVPLVMQVGKWRRRITVPTVTACADTPLTTIDETRLPRNQTEGHIPRFALTTGQSDALECLLLKIGLDRAEFTLETGSGRVNFFSGGGGAESFNVTLNAGAVFTPANPWWDSYANLAKYDVILHACDGGMGQYGVDTTGVDREPVNAKSLAARTALETFANKGGRVFASHWQAYWFEKGPPSFMSIATFEHDARLPNPYEATIDQTFAEGRSLASWMLAVGGSTTLGSVVLSQNAANRLVKSATGGGISRQWIYAPTLTPQSVQFLSAATPIPGGTCGRIVLSDLHVSDTSFGILSDLPAQPFPSGCITTTLSPQEKVLEYMLFDIGSCVK